MRFHAHANSIAFIMAIIADMHAHFYSCYDRKRALGFLRENLHRLAPEATNAAFVMACAGQHILAELADAKENLTGVKVVRTYECGTVQLVEDNGASLFLLPARQITTAERLEVLALGLAREIPDQMPVMATAQEVLDRGGLPVLAWAAGKWLFSRAALVERVLMEFSPDVLCLGDTTLRPNGWPAPSLIRHAVATGFKLLAGSDPLPCPGEEKYLGRYACLIEGEMQTDTPVRCILRLLREAVPLIRGKRCDTAEVAFRLFRYFRLRR
ncbi:MAG: hypothetical protein N2255_02295 [Kiritimatiellae bacterium]|nr:hypothetical protein [Kiritimatiellia bacterium]